MPLFFWRTGKTTVRDRPRRKRWWNWAGGGSGLNFLSAYVPGPRISGLWYRVRGKEVFRATTPKDSHGIVEADITPDQEHEAQRHLAGEWRRDDD